jgi:hypothetical protein
MYRAVVIGANGDGLSGMASKDDQCGFGVGARRLGVRIVRRIEFAVGVLGKNAGALFLCGSPRRLDLNKMRPCGYLAVDMRCDFRLIAESV